ncbi:MAG: hypothetical protein M1831_002677 [Alyxoria varia]|nr:MAG: hypothetical protein M1831_002677 [Alyxoria varia]
MAGRLAQHFAGVRRIPDIAGGGWGPRWCHHHGQRSWIRGKKKNAKARSSLDARLLVDLPAYGRKGVDNNITPQVPLQKCTDPTLGSIVPVPVGQMRNYFYPTRIANYVLLGDSRRLRQDGVPIERDVNFMRDLSARPSTADSPARLLPSGSQSHERRGAGGVDAGARGPKSQSPVLDTGLLPAKDAYELLATNIPPVLDFYRTRIGSQAVQNPDAQSDSSLLDDPPPEISPRQVPENIYGSVSPADIGAAIRSLLHGRKFSGLVALADENVSIISSRDLENRLDKIKRVGEFEYEVRLRGFEEPIRRRVRVLSDNPRALRDVPSTGPDTSISPKSSESARSNNAVQTES